MDITVFLGAPGSGKGTQAKKLAETGNFQHFSTGDMLRAAIHAGSEVGLKAKEFINRGELVPDGVMIELIANALSKLPSSTRAILDGFPRTVPQANALDKSPGTAVTRAIFFEVPNSLLIDRLTGRRICEKCGQPYHVKFLPSSAGEKCERCGGKLIQRPDDNENVVRRRLEVFAEQNDQLLHYYDGSKKLRRINADAAVDKLQSQLLGLLK